MTNGAPDARFTLPAQAREETVEKQCLQQPLQCQDMEKYWWRRVKAKQAPSFHTIQLDNQKKSKQSDA
jgi:hypothetical protein